MISSAISGRVDRLKGLKENVIIGRKIPVGTSIEPLAIYVGDDEAASEEASTEPAEGELDNI